MDSNKKNEGRVTVDFIVGGGFQAYAIASNADVVVAIDSRDEIDRLPELPHLIKVPLGEQDTILSLLERLQEKLPEAGALLEEYRHRPNVHLAHGMAQDPRLGECAIRELALNGELEKLFDRVFIRVQEACNGQLCRLVVRVLNSTAGGMGAGGGHVVGAEFCAYAERKTTAKVRHQRVHLGGLTYAAVAERAPDNTALSTARDLAQVLDGHRSAGRLLDLELYELPLRDRDGLVVRGNRALRDMLAGSLLQARFARSVDEELDRWEVNRKSANPFGCILRVQAGWSGRLDQGLLIAAAASLYRGRLKDLRMNPDPPEMTIAAGVEAELEPLGSPPPTVEEVMEAIRRGAVADSPLLDRLLNAELQRFQATVLVRTPQDKAVSPEGVLGEPGRPGTLEECRAVCRRFRGVIAHLEQAQRAAEGAQEAARKTFKKRRRQLLREIRRVRSALRYHLEVTLLSRRRVLGRIERALAAYREAYERYGEARTRAEALAAAAEQMRQELARYQERWIARVERGLEEAAGRRSIYLDTVEFAPLEVVYADLLDATLRAVPVTAGENGSRAWGPTGIVLIRSIGNVTPQGLGEMLQTDPEPGAIIAALGEKERFPWKAPLWGGREASYDEPRYHCIVLPPVAAADLEELRRAAEKRHFGATLTTAETAAAGCCIVALSFFPVAQHDEVLPRLYARKLPAGRDEESPALSLWQSGNGSEEVRK